jgi:hypothetical protein
MAKRWFAGMPFAAAHFAIALKTSGAGPSPLGSPRLAIGIRDSTSREISFFISNVRRVDELWH